MGEYFGALECRPTAEDEALVDRLVSPGHPSTPDYNDPIEGRVPRSGQQLGRRSERLGHANEIRH
jgi:hypothetical protein